MLFPICNEYCLKIFDGSLQPNASHLQVSGNVRTFTGTKLRDTFARMNITNFPDASRCIFAHRKNPASSSWKKSKRSSGNILDIDKKAVVAVLQGVS